MASEPYAAMKVRILLALGTGLRRGDIDSLKISDIDFEKNSISTTSRKTKKSIASIENGVGSVRMPDWQI